LDPRPEESAEDLYENAPCGYLSTLPDGTIVKVNQTLLTWLGYSREELLGGKRLQELLTGGGRIFHETHYAPLLRMQGFVNEFNFDLVRRDGRPLPVLLNSVQKLDAAGKPQLHRTTVFDISDRKNYERELLLARRKAEQAAKDKADLLATLSHEIRTPMHAIIGLANLLRKTELSAQQQQYIHILQSSSENLLGLLNNILDFSKIEAGKVGLEERPFSPRELVQGLFHGLNVKAEEKGLTFRVLVDEAVPARLLGDPIKLGQVLTNLLANAIKFTERGSVTLTVRVRERSLDAVVLDFRVTDTGLGIAQERLAQIFEEFTQASYDIGLKYGGTGLGLAISQKLLGLYGRSLQVESTPGAGSTFFFDLRLRRGAEEAPAPSGPVERPLDPQPLAHLKLLVAEDNRINVFVLSSLLREWSVDFDVVEDGRQALEQVQAVAYDVVLMDLQMPELDGYEATRAIRALPDARFHRLPIIALTASDRAEEEERLEGAGFSDFVTKPFRPEELLAKLVAHGARRLPPEPAPPVKQGSAPQDALGSAIALPRFTLEEFRNLAEGDPEGMVELSTIAIGNFEKSKRDLRRALEAGDPKEFEFQHHKLAWTVDLLQAHALRAALTDGRALLGAPARGAATVESVIQSIQRELDAIIEALKAEVREEG
jgi:PAS domain S-box-containing protein